MSDELADGSAIEVVIEGRIVALFRFGDRLYALDGMCAHQGGPIADGFVQNNCVTCPWHGWQYELNTGIQTINRQPLQETFNVREADGQIEIEL
jgi:nitrite reductase/ring-hydroxylating ferredoxin subunit